MTETQAKSGGSGTSTTPVDEEPKGADKAGREAAGREAAGRAALDGGPALTPAQARRLACDAAVTAIVTDGPQVLAQGRARRYATRAQRRALLMRDGGCAVPGCEETRVERLSVIGGGARSSYWGRVIAAERVSA